MVDAKISAGEPAYVNGERETVQVFDRPGSWVGLDCPANLGRRISGGGEQCSAIATLGPRRRHSDTHSTRVARLRPELIGRSADFHFNDMLMAIVPEGNCLSGQLPTIEREQTGVGRISGEPGDGDVKNRLPVAVVDFEGRPRSRQTGCQPQAVAFQVHAQQSLDQQPVHPAG